MIKINLITIGRLKEKYLCDAYAEYVKRLSRFCELNIIELEPQKLPSHPSENQIKSALNNEAEMILKRIRENSFTFILCIEGNKISSEKLAEKISGLKSNGTTINFVIGSSYGLSSEVKNRADFKLSVSDMTFPHQLFRVMLLEQIYRAFQINSGSEYHK